VRRPTSVADLAQIAQTTDDEVIKIVEIFRQKGRTFLTPPPSIPLQSDSMIDISHESLMRVWDKLKSWVEDESAAVKMYSRLAESAEQFHQGKTGLWGPPDLQLAINWREKQQPNLAWAIRFNPAFERTMVYLKTSEEEYIAEEENKIRLQKRALRRSRIVAVIIGVAGLISIGLGLLALMQRQDALKSESRALEQEKIAVANEKQAQVEKENAKKSAEEALEQKNIAEEQTKFAEQQRQSAVANANEAQKQRSIANEQTIVAQDKQKLADQNAQKAIEEQKKAEQAKLEADRRKMLSIAQSMAVKSEQMQTDTLLKGILAFQAYSFNNDYNGVAFDPDIYKSIYTSLKYFKGSDYNVYSGHTGIIRTIGQFNDQLITGGSDGQIIKWNTSDKSLDTLINNVQIVKKLLINGQYIYSLTSSEIEKYDLTRSTSEVFKLPTAETNNFFISKTGKFILINNQSVVMADDLKTQGIEVYKEDIKINAAKFDIISGKLFIALSNGKILYWKNLMSEQGKPVEIANIPDSNWGDLSYNSSKQLLAAGTTNKQATIYLWDISTGELKQTLRGHTSRITGIDFSNDGSLMASSSYDKTVRLWHMDDLKTLPIVFDDHDAWVTSVMFTKDDKYVVSGDKNGKIRKLPTDVKTMVEGYCGFLSRELTQNEWLNYVGTDIPYKPTKCINR